MFGPRGGNVEAGGGPDQSCQIVTIGDAGSSQIAPLLTDLSIRINLDFLSY